MKLLEKDIILNQSGTVKILPEDPDDLLLAFNLLSAGDTVSAHTTRKINLTPDSVKKNVTRVRVELELKISAVEYTKSSPAIRVRGRITVENELIKAGAFHTIELEENKEFVLKKPRWDVEKVNELMDGCDRSKTADLAVVLMQEGLTNIFLVGKSVTRCATLTCNKNGAKSKSNKHFEDVFRSFTKNVDFDKVRCVVIGSPGTIKDEFRLYLISQAQKIKIKSILNNKSRIMMVKTSGGEKGCLKEVLEDKAVMGLIKDTKGAMEIKGFKEFTDVLSSDSDRACYGLKGVENANALGAIDSLLITDDLVRSDDVLKQKKFSGLMDSVMKSGGKVLVFPADSVGGEELTKLTGIGAVLRFPLPDVEEMEL